MMRDDQFQDDKGAQASGYGVPAAYEGLIECKGGCGAPLWSPGYCQKCSEEVQALLRLWDFDGHRRAKQRGDGWISKLVTAGCLIGIAFYFAFEFIPQVADFICGGTN